MLVHTLNQLVQIFYLSVNKNSSNAGASTIFNHSRWSEFSDLLDICSDLPSGNFLHSYTKSSSNSFSQYRKHICRIDYSPVTSHIARSQKADRWGSRLPPSCVHYIVTIILPVIIHNHYLLIIIPSIIFLCNNIVLTYYIVTIILPV